MAETMRTKILEVLAEASEPSDIQRIAEGAGSPVKSVTEALSRLNRDGYVANPTKGFWQIETEGRDELNKIKEQEARSKKLGQETPYEPPGEIAETVPSQADLFRSIGENLGVGAKKGGVPLDALIYYLERTADLDNLGSVWNALTEMGVANDVKKRWVKIYAQTIPGKKIPEELKEKLEIGQETEKVKSGSEEIQPKPKRFSVVGGEIMGDSEGDYNFKEALQYVAQLRGASPDEAGSMALELSKMGPEMLATILSAMTPLINKEKEGGSTLETIQTLKELGLIGKTGEGEPSLLDQIAKLGDLGLLKKTGEEGGGTLGIIQALKDLGAFGKEGGGTLETIQALKDLGAFGKEGGGTLETIQTLKELGLVGKTGEGEPSLLDQIAKLRDLGLLKQSGEEDAGSQTIKALETQIKELSDSLRKQEMDTVKNAVVALSNQLTDLRKEIVTQDKLEGRYGLMQQAMTTIDSQLTGLRSDTRPLLDTLARGGGGEPTRRSPEEKARIVKGLKGAVAQEREARALEDELMFGKPQG